MSLKPQLPAPDLPLILFLALAVAVFPAAAQGPADGVGATLQEIERAAGGPVHAARSADTGLVTFLSVGAERSVPVTGISPDSPEEVALAFLRSYAPAFGLRDAAAEVALRGPAERDELGMDHVRFRQVVRGVPVTAGEITVHLRDAGVVAVNAETLPGLEGFDVRPAFAADLAADRVLAYVTNRLGRTGFELSEPRLEILNRGLLEGGRQPSRLAWFVEARGFDVREYVWVDAKKGRLLLRFSQLTDARDRRIYNGNNGAALPGTLIRSEGGPVTGNSDADLAYDYSGDTYDYFWNEHGRDSYDGAGAALHSTVDHCPTPGNCPYVNAFWNGAQMVYGDGFPAADDVVAHELTHAVTERTANLFYYMQSGALNESFSDIFGEAVDLTNAGGTDTAGVRWLMGEDVPGLGAIRDMENPGAFGDPARVGDANYYCGYGDGGGVHSNSGVPNRFFSLLVDGGSYNGQTVTGIGLGDAGRIAYRALAHYLLSGSAFSDAADAFRQSCADLVGTGGVTVATCQEVEDALAAVEMADPPCGGAGAGQYPPLCSNGQQPLDLFFDDFEAGGSNTNWLVQWTAANAWFYDNPPYAQSGSWHLSGYNYDIVNDARALMSGNVALPAGAYLHFHHSWDFEPPNYDGGVVEYSLNNGTSWTDAMGLQDSGAGYTATISPSFGNPLGGRSAFAGSSRGYTGTRLNLSSLSGQSLKLRFRIGTDNAFGWWGWDVDNVRIYQCAGCTYSLSDSAVFVGAAGGSDTTGVTTGPECAWQSSSNAGWLTVTPGGTGNGNAGFTAAPNNTGSPRTGTLTVAGQTLTVYQGAETDFYTLTPCRVFDTRSNTPLSSLIARTFDVAGICGVPATAKAVSANVTIVGPGGQGYLTVFPGGLSRPIASTLNYTAGVTRANNAIIPLAPDGSGDIQAFALVVGNGTVHVILDVNGYFE